MPHQTIIEYPRYISVTEAIEIAKKLVSTFKGSTITKDALASALQHRSSSSGTFLVKLSDLKKYGIIEGRGTAFYTTDIAKKIAIPTDPKEKDTAILGMINNVKILSQLHDAFHSDIAPTESEMLVQLINITKKDRSELQPLLADISKLYKDALPYMNVKSSATKPEMLQEGESVGINIDILNPNPTDFLTFTAEGIALKIKNDDKHLERAKAFLDLWLKDDEKKDSKKPKEKTT